MRSWQLAVCCLALLAAAGCRANNSSSISLLEQENCQLEAKVFELAGLVKDCQRENDRLRRRLGEDGRDQPIAGPRLDPSGSAATDTEPDDFPVQLESPAIEVPGEEIPAEEFMKRFSEPKRLVPPDDSPTFPGEEAPDGLPPPPPTSCPKGSARPTSAAPAARSPRRRQAPRPPDIRPSRSPTTPALPPSSSTRGSPAATTPTRAAGHEGVMAVVHLRDVDGTSLAAAAPMSVVVLDPALSGDGARVARWDFTAEEVAERYRKTPLSEGVHLEMVWPGALPIHGDLHLFVRYTTDDGRRLQVDRLIEIDVPALQAQLPPLPSLTELPAQSAEPPGDPNEPTVASGEPAEQWQRRATPAAEPPADEPVRTSLLPKEESTGPVESTTQPSAPKRRAPTWSPNRR